MIRIIILETQFSLWILGAFKSFSRVPFEDVCKKLPFRERPFEFLCQALAVVDRACLHEFVKIGSSFFMMKELMVSRCANKVPIILRSSSTVRGLGLPLFNFLLSFFSTSSAFHKQIFHFEYFGNLLASS